MFARNMPGGSSGRAPRRSRRAQALKRYGEGGIKRAAAVYCGDIDFSVVAAAAELEFESQQEAAARAALRRLQDLTAGALTEDRSTAGGSDSRLDFSVLTTKGRFRESVDLHETPPELQRRLATIALRALQREWEHGGGFEGATATVCRSLSVVPTSVDPVQRLPQQPRDETGEVNGSNASGLGRDSRKCSVSFACCDENVYFQDESVTHCAPDKAEWTKRSTPFDIASVVVDDPRLSLFEEGAQPDSSQLLMWTHYSF